ncbi:MAG: peptidylprolyl isomerase [Prevotellaceae bacterium]|nr:peptidylprolyl isomerase [Prevotellaceae bacterium]
MRKNLVYAGLILILAAGMESCVKTSLKKNEEYKVKIETSYGDIVVKLYNETPAHRDNFIKLVSEGFYDGTLFHRVIKDFMIQAGDPLSKTAKPGESLGTGDVGYKIPGEFMYPKYYHKYGALAAARQGDQVNPERQSSGCQFYIVVGKKISEQELNLLEKQMYQKQEMKLFQAKADGRQDEIKKYRMERNQQKLDLLRDNILAEVHKELNDSSSCKFTEQQRKDYATAGGTPHLDNDYTVFGEVLEGLNVVANISEAKTGSGDRPSEDIKIIKTRIVK